MMDDITCAYCDANLSHRERVDGWCESCGKRLPASAQIVNSDNKPISRPVELGDGPGIFHSLWAGLKAVLSGRAFRFETVLTAGECDFCGHRSESPRFIAFLRIGS